MRCRFRGRGYNHLSTGCTSCPNHNVETLPHVFFRCIHARPLMTYIYPSIDLLLKHTPFKLFHLTLNVFPPNISLPIQRMVVTLLQITFYVLWTHRNARHFDGVNPSVPEGQHKIRHLFTRVLTAQFTKFGLTGLAPFRKTFCHTPQICQVVNNATLEVNLI